MRTRLAIQRALRFCAPGEGGILNGLRLVPRIDRRPPAVWAWDGEVGCHIVVDQDLPSIVLPAQELQHALKTGKAEPEFRELGYGKIEIAVGAARSTVLGRSTQDFEPLPEIPELQLVPDWEEARRVFGYRDVHHPKFRNVNFESGRVEATDNYIVGRAYVTGLPVPDGLSWLVPGRTFNHWRKGDTAVGFDGERAYFQFGDETRVAQRALCRYQNLGPVLPDWHPGNEALVDRPHFTEAVARGLDASYPSNGLILKFEEEQLEILSWSGTRKSEQTFTERVRVLNPPIQPGHVHLSGKLVLKALKPLVTPVLALGYGDPRVPLRVDSGVVVSCVWPISPDDHDKRSVSAPAGREGT